MCQPWMRSDDGAAYAETLYVDCSAVPPTVARPGDPGNGLPLAQAPAGLRIDIAYGGSCTVASAKASITTTRCRIGLLIAD